MRKLRVKYLSKMDEMFDNNNSIRPQYYAQSDMEIEVGDIVLVERYNDTMTLAQVKVIHEKRETPEKYHSLKVLDVVTDGCDAFKEMYNEVAKERIKKQIDKRVEELDKMIVYEKYASFDEEFKELLDEYKAKGGNKL